MKVNGLSELERQILDFEAKSWKYAGAKQQAVRDTFDLGYTRYCQLLNDLISKEGAEAYQPILVHRLRRMRDSRIKARLAEY